jgi:uncharacterized membrane protein YhhN
MYPTAAYLCAVPGAIALAILLWSEWRGKRLRAAVCKVIASNCFLAAALLMGALGTMYGRMILLALVLSWFGDVFLISRNARLFLAGLVSFLLGHFAFGAAFLFRGASAGWCEGAAVVLLITVCVVGWWIVPRAPADMRLPVVAYIVVISLMVCLAWGTYGARGTLWIPVGAVMFYLSDISVARDRFVSPGLANALWGLPLYYAAQFSLAFSVGQ